MQALNCLIVEDEPLAAGILKEYVEEVPGLRLVGVCGDVLEANALLHAESVELVFLDINLPRINGLELIRSRPAACQFILTTAYHEYAIQGFDLNVVDYLLKPIEFSRFLQAINKVYDRLHSAPITPSQESDFEDRFHFFNVDKKHIKVFLKDILYIESLKDYVRIHTTEGRLVTRYQIGELEDLFGGESLLRIHKSYLVNLAQIKAYGASFMEVGNASLPIGRTYRKAVELALKSI